MGETDMDAQDNLAVIPARGGSRRVPRKNIRIFHGEPAIAYTIRAAIDSGVFARVVVSTDDLEIAETARRWGAEVPFLRDAGLADDQTPVSAASRDALARLDPDGTRFRAVAQLMPTCPLRTAADVRASHWQFVRTAPPAQLSVMRFGWQNPWWAMRLSAEGQTLEPVFGRLATARSQDLPELYCPSGAIWWAPADVLRRAATFHVPGRTGWELPWWRGIDIDTESDWRLAEALALLEQEASVVASA
jgi:N-acylneuraminate cytidylyltransferase